MKDYIRIHEDDNVIVALNEMNLYGAIIGKAYYTGAIDLKKALEVTG